jgi:hypothetical protein
MRILLATICLLVCGNVSAQHHGHHHHGPQLNIAIQTPYFSLQSGVPPPVYYSPPVVQYIPQYVPQRVGRTVEVCGPAYRVRDPYGNIAFQKRCHLEVW